MNKNSHKNALKVNQTLDSSDESKIISCIDLFCGVGGLTHGLIRGGIKVVAGVDIDSQCCFPYETNNNSLFIERDIRELSGNEINNLFGYSQTRLLAGCAPCQPFSTYTRKNRKKSPRFQDEKWDLVSDFGRLIHDTKPELITMENVPQLVDEIVFEKFIQGIKKDGYHTWWKVVDCSGYGVPQTRKRLVLLASKLGEIELLPPDQHHVTVREAIYDLPPLVAGGTDPNDKLHTSSSLSDLNLRRIKASKPGRTWRDWDEDLIAPCHRKNSGQTYPSVYGRMEWDTLAPTITTQCFGYGNGRFGHPEQDRAISLREAAILQTFPRDYRFLSPNETVRFNRLGRLIGNAVPVRMGEVIAKSLIIHVNARARLYNKA
ncbi:DNA (cytosine-5-)-methyltransferase [Pannus brasiliensis CCIBt3594]|uniref:DNA (cytosine-5-)-methyltransferase n=1 Tax=Pannus brasiliensis CCIBt3594 TaxID=1427578 RepID=A0AAW9QT55_9CHRO